MSRLPPRHCTLDTGHISLYGAIQSLKHSSLPDEDFDTTNDHFNAVQKIQNAIQKWQLWFTFVSFFSLSEILQKISVFSTSQGSVWSVQFFVYKLVKNYKNFGQKLMLRKQTKCFDQKNGLQKTSNFKNSVDNFQTNKST